MHSDLLALLLEWLTNHWEHCTVALLPASNIGVLKQNQFKMQTLELNKMGLAPMEEYEMQEQNGGFIPLIILGVKLSAGCVTAIFCTGMTIGAGVAAVQHADSLSKKK